MYLTDCTIVTVQEHAIMYNQRQHNMLVFNNELGRIRTEILCDVM